jgi:hypothetical protein
MDAEHLLPVGKGKLLDRMHDLDPGIRHPSRSWKPTLAKRLPSHLNLLR